MRGPYVAHLLHMYMHMYMYLAKPPDPHRSPDFGASLSKEVYISEVCVSAVCVSAVSCAWCVCRCVSVLACVLSRC